MDELLEHPRILIVCNDEYINCGMADILKNKGYLVDVACCGGEAVEKSRECSYNLVLIDFRLPDMLGSDLLKDLHDSEPPMFKIMVTDFSSFDYVLRFLGDGIDDYLVKPVKVEELLCKVSNCLGKRLEDQRFGGDRIAEFVETKARKFKVKHLFREKC
jgi:DNA-binding response OmpR family regulator